MGGDRAPSRAKLCDSLLVIDGGEDLMHTRAFKSSDELIPGEGKKWESRRGVSMADDTTGQRWLM
jgi:hypothetical protein